MNNLRAKMAGCRRAPSRLTCWLEKRPFRPYKLRKVLIDNTLVISFCKVFSYRMLQSIVKVGVLPAYVPDMMIIVLSVLEAMVSPFVSWLGYWRRRTIMLIFTSILLVTMVSWLFLPDVILREDTEFCHSRVIAMTEDTMQYTAVRLRLAFAVCTSVVLVLGRAVVWCHALATLEEHDPGRISVHLGAVIFVRMLSLAIGHRITGMTVNIPQVISFVVGFAIQILQILYFMPDKSAQGETRLKPRGDDRKLLVSCRRVLSNPLAVAQMMSLGLLVAAVWGFTYHNTDIVKAKYLIHKKNETALSFTEVFQYIGVLMSVLYIGLKWSAPIQLQFCKLHAMKQSLRMCIAVGIIFLALALTVNCEHGRVAGLDTALYSNPNCSADCGCTAGWMEFSPICVVDDMTTYISPCQAGCAGIEYDGALMVYTNCTCATGSRAVLGACSDPGCRPVSDLYRMLYVTILTFSALAFQSHTALLLKTVDTRDKAVVLGLTGSVISIVAFVFGHAAFNSINGATCIWFDSQRCHIHSPRLPYLVALAGAALVFISTVICLVTLICLNMAKRNSQETSL